jgi:Pilus formation protein N terminal region
LRFFHQLKSDLPHRAPVPLRIALTGMFNALGYSMSVECQRTRLSALLRFRPLFRALSIGVLLWPAVILAESTRDAIAVNVDQAKLVKLPSRVATIVVGNPLIADVTLQTGGVLVVTGKGYGATNFIAMDRAGEVLVDRIIQVEGPSDKLVTVYRGVERESYSCMPVCQRRATLGDGDGYFKSVLGQAGDLSGQASGAAAGKPTN